MSDPGNTVNTICTEVFGTAPDSVRHAEVGMVNTVCILTVGIGKYILRLNPEKASRIMQEAVYLKSYFEGNTARPLCIRCAVQIFVRLPKFDAGLLTQVKENLGNMTESWQADDVQRR